MRTQPATSAARSPNLPQNSRTHLGWASNTAQCARLNIEARQPSLPTSCRSHRLQSRAHPEAHRRLRRSLPASRNQLRQTENATTKDGKGLGYRRVFSKLLDR